MLENTKHSVCCSMPDYLGKIDMTELFSNLHKLFNDQVLPRLLQDLSAPAVSVTATAGRAALPVSQKRCSDF